jgi:hypothetical protein
MRRAGGGVRLLGRLHSLTFSCRLAGVDPEVYLADVLRRVSTTPQADVATLTPRGWKATRAAEAAAATAKVESPATRRGAGPASRGSAEPSKPPGGRSVPRDRSRAGARDRMRRAAGGVRLLGRLRSSCASGLPSSTAFVDAEQVMRRNRRRYANLPKGHERMQTKRISGPRASNGSTTSLIFHRPSPSETIDAEWLTDLSLQRQHQHQHQSAILLVVFQGSELIPMVARCHTASVHRSNAPI